MRPLVLVACLLLNACAAASARSTATEPAPPPSAAVDDSCRTDADCEVKNVGNCCGYYPACVNRDSAVFPDRVKAECARHGTMGVCGFPEIRGCSCVEGRCEDVTDSATPVR